MYSSMKSFHRQTDREREREREEGREGEREEGREGGRERERQRERAKLEYQNTNERENPWCSNQVHKKDMYTHSNHVPRH